VSYLGDEIRKEEENVCYLIWNILGRNILKRVNENLLRLLCFEFLKQNLDEWDFDEDMRML
jgi:hypothetical protein